MLENGGNHCTEACQFDWQNPNVNLGCRILKDETGARLARTLAPPRGQLDFVEIPVIRGFFPPVTTTGDMSPP
jgi:hypothetical protein